MTLREVWTDLIIRRASAPPTFPFGLNPPVTKSAFMIPLSEQRAIAGYAKCELETSENLDGFSPKYLVSRDSSRVTIVRILATARA